MSDRAILFIDGSNWYHSLKEREVRHRIDLDYAAISEKLVQERDWIETRYYVGPMKQEWDRDTYAQQQKFFRYLQADDDRISLHPGRLELRPQENELATELREFLSNNTSEISGEGFRALRNMAERHSEVEVRKEKEVDVMLAVDMVRLALEERYDAAYLLSADGDYVPAVETVSSIGPAVYVASPNRCTALQQVARFYITLDDPAWFNDCYRNLDPSKYAARPPGVIK